MRGIRNLFQRHASTVVGALLVVCLIATATPARTRHSKRTKDAARHASAAAKVLNQIMATPDNAIPHDLLNKAEAIAVFPGVVKAAFIFGGRGGQGVISKRTSHGWSAPAFFNLGGGSFGPQIGAEKTDYVLLIMNDDGLKGLLGDKFEFGAEASVAAGPVGRTASAATNGTMKAEILSYSRSHGAFIGASLKGAVITPDNDLNEAFYGKSALSLLSGNSMNVKQMSNAVKVFPETLDRYSNRASHHSASNDPKAISPDNARIAREVRHQLMLLPYYSVFDWLEFQINPDGAVILRGEVTSPPDTKASAEAAAKSVAGVKNVVNDIEVLPVSPNDQRLRRRVYHRLFNWDSPLFHYAVGSYHPIHIIVENGRLTLKGEVDSAMDKQLAYSRASSVPGLFAVDNQLQVTTQKAREREMY